MILFIEFLLVYCIGFVAGYLTNKTQTEVAVDKILQNAKKMFPDNSLKAGIIRRPTAKDLEKRNLPQKIKETRDAMVETLDKIPELQEMRKALGEHR